MVTDNKVYAQFLGIGYLFDSLDAAVEHDDEFHTCFCRKLYSFPAHSVPFLFTVGDVVVDVGIELLQELIHQSHCRTPVYVVVAIHHDALFAPHCVVQTVYCHVHVVHQERVYQLV